MKTEFENLFSDFIDTTSPNYVPPMSLDFIKDRIKVLKNVYIKVNDVYSDEKKFYSKLESKEQLKDTYEDYSFNHELERLEREFYSIHNSSSIITLYTFFESSLLRICDLINTVHPTIQSYYKYSKNIRNTAVVKKVVDYFIYLDLLDEQFLATDKWGYIDNFRLLRNKLVHGEGILSCTTKPSIEERDIQLISCLDGVSLFHNHLIIIDSSYVINTFSVVEKTLSLILNSVLIKN